MATKQFYHDIDLVKVGQLVDARIQNVTSAEASALAATLTPANTGLIIFDTTLQAIRIWDGTKFSSVSSDLDGDVVFKGVINPTNLATVVSTANKGHQFVADTAADLTIGSTTHTVEVGDIVLFVHDAGQPVEATVFNRNIDAATTDQAGIIEIALQSEVDSGVSTSLAITPATLAGSRLAADVAQNQQDISDNAADISSLQTFTGEGTALDTSAGDLAAAINELVSRADSADVEVDALEAFVGEGVTLTTAASTLADAVNELVGRSDSADGRMSAVEGEVDSLQVFTGEGTPLDTVATDLAAAINELHGEVDANFAAIEGNDSDIAANAAQAAANLAAIIANDSDIASLDARITQVEGDILSNVDSDIADLQAQIAGNDSDIASAFAQIAGNDSDILSLEGRMTAAEVAIVGNDSDILSLEGRMSAAETAIVGNDSDIAANLASITSLQGFTGEGTPLDTVAQDLAAALNEIHAEVDTNDARIAGNDSDIAAMQTFAGFGTALTTDAADLAGAVNELQSEIVSNDSDILDLQGRTAVLEARDHIKCHNSTVAVTAGVPRSVAHNLDLASAANFVVNVMDSDNSQISVDIEAVDKDTLNIRSLVDLTNVKVTVMGK
jgi:hypothetical protein